MTNTNTAITERQISALRCEASIAGDAMQIAICDLALNPEVARLVRVGTVEYALDPDERARLVEMTQDDALEECERVIAIDPDAQCAQHGSARWRCAASHEER